MNKTVIPGFRVFLVLLFAAAAASAHVPMMETPETNSFNDALKILRPTYSYAIYGNLEKPGDIDYYTFEVKEPMKAHASLLVPFRPEYLDFYPVYAVIGPGLPSPQGKIPFDLPPGCGAIVISGTASEGRPTFYEPFSRTRYYEGIPKFEQELKQPGIYYIVVWHPGNETGAYILGYGLAEKFTAQDWANTFKLLSSIRSGSWETKRGKPQAPCPCMNKDAAKCPAADSCGCQGRM